MMTWLSACSDIFDGDYSGYQVRLLTPADSTVTSNSTIQLHWERIETATEYQLQVVQPKFESIERIVKDTITNSDVFVLNDLEKGKRYQWRIRAIGSNFVTKYSNSRTFIIQ